MLKLRQWFKQTHSILVLVTILDFIFLGLPTFIILLGSFTAGNVIAFPPEGLSLQWYAKLFRAGHARLSYGLCP